jgi:EthD domain
MEGKGKMLCLTIYSYKKAGLSDEQYREYMLKTHAPLASTLMEKYGIIGFTMVSIPIYTSSRSIPD